MWRRMQWTGCHCGERHGRDRGCGRGRNGQGVMVRRDMEVTGWGEGHNGQGILVRTHGGDRGCGVGHNGQGVMVGRDMDMTEVVEEDTMDRVTW